MKRQIQVDHDRATPVQQNRNERAGLAQDAGIPTIQAWLVSAALVNLALSILVLLVTGGELVFWLVTGCVSLSAFLWIIATLKPSIPSIAPQERGAAALLATLAAFALAALGGFSAWCFAEVGRRIYPAVKAPAWVVVAWFVFSLSFWLHLEATLLQRLLQPWAFQRQFVWKALGALLQAFGIHVIEKGLPRAHSVDFLPDREIIVTLRDPETGHLTHYGNPPVKEGVWVAVCNVLYGKTFCEDSLCGNGNPLPGGKRGRDMKNELRDWMIGAGLLAWNQTNSVTGEGVPTQGVTLTEDGQDTVLATIGMVNESG